jgi:5-methyltetrahydropteroyltriglutamate--homocysteine methyltransferase
LLNDIIRGIDGIRIGIHVCRGNWSRSEEVLLEGDYTKLIPAFSSMNVGQYVLEYATPRAGELAVVGEALAHKEIGLGVVNPRTAQVEPVEEIVARAEAAMEWFDPEKIFLNPDCGFGCFANRCVNDAHTATEKLRNIARAAQILRSRGARS